VLLPLRAGPERSVAATKTFLAACFALLQLTAAWSGDAALGQACEDAPTALDRAGACDWGPALAGLAEAQSLYVVGRGWGLGIAQEMALKFKETCRIHAEAYSAAEVLHGPLALVGPGFPAIVLDPGDEGGESARAVAQRMGELGAGVLHAGMSAMPGIALPLPSGLAAPLVPLAQIRAFYGGLAALSQDRGFDPDRPPHLSKVTRTI
jgi:glucosamine--fructose-6-phosphate aminotransferase (isomerizing)